MSQSSRLSKLFHNKIWTFLSDKDNNKKSARIFYAVIMLLSCGFSLFMVSRHECFRDEAQAWLISRDVPLSGLFTQLKYEIHPILWFLVLMPFSKLGFPYITMQIISWLFVSASLYILLFKLNVNKLLKATLAFSPLFLYWYPAVSRNYSLAVFLLFLLMMYYPKRHEKPIRYAVTAALLFSTHLIMLGIGLAVIVIEVADIIVDKRNKIKLSIRRYIALGIEISGALFLYFQLSDAGNYNKDVGGFELEALGFVDRLFTELYCVLADVFCFDTTTKFFSYYNDGVLDIQFILSTLVLMFLIMLFVLLIKRPRQLVLYILGAGCIVGMQTTIYFSNPHRTGFLHLLFLFIIVTLDYEKIHPPKQRKDGKKDININNKSVLTVFVTLICIASIIISPFTYFIKDINGNFSGSKGVAEYLDKNVPDDVTVIGFWENNITSIIAYTKTRNEWYSTHFYQTYTYVTWSDAYKEASEKYRSQIYLELEYIAFCKKFEIEYTMERIRFLDSFYETIKIISNKDDKVVVVFSKSINDIFKYDHSINKDKFVLVYTSESMYDTEESFFVYELTI